MDYPLRQWVSASTSYGKRAVKGRVHHCLVATRCPDRHHPTMWVIHTHSLRSVSTPRSISCATGERPFAALRVTSGVAAGVTPSRLLCRSGQTLRCAQGDIKGRVTQKGEHESIEAE